MNLFYGPAKNQISIMWEGIQNELENLAKGFLATILE